MESRRNEEQRIQEDQNENDWLLESYIRSLNGTNADMHITVLMDGFLVSGLLVGGNRYFQQILDRYLADGSEDLETSIKQLQSRIDKYVDDRFKPEIPIEYFHMVDATFHHPIGQGIPSKGVSFRGKIKRVSGFYFGGWLPSKIDVNEILSQNSNIE